MITKEEIDYIIDQKTPFLIKNKKGKWIFPFKSIEAQNQVIEHLKKGVYEKLSKLSQHDVIKNKVAVCSSVYHDKDMKVFGHCNTCFMKNY